MNPSQRRRADLIHLFATANPTLTTAECEWYADAVLPRPIPEAPPPETVPPATPPTVLVGGPTADS